MSCEIKLYKSDVSKLMVIYENDTKQITALVAGSALDPLLINDFIHCTKGMQCTIIYSDLNTQQRATFDILIQMSPPKTPHYEALSDMLDSEPPPRLQLDSTATAIHELDTDVLDYSHDYTNCDIRHPRTNITRLIDDSIIQGLTRTVQLAITNSKLVPPNFLDRSRKGYRKIKNFIHNITKIWLSPSEVEVFVIEYCKLIG